MWVDQFFCKWKRANDSGGIQCTWAQSHLLFILIHYFLFSCFYRKMWQCWWMKEELIEIARIRAIQEAICGFLLDEVINPKGEFHGDLRTSVAKEDPAMRNLIRYYSRCLIICNISCTFELLSVPYMTNIYNVSVICCSNNTVQCKEYDYIVTYAKNTHSHTYKNEKKRNKKVKKHLVPASNISRH